jgi:hypothetical protein
LIELAAAQPPDQGLGTQARSPRPGPRIPWPQRLPRPPGRHRSSRREQVARRARTHHGRPRREALHLGEDEVAHLPLGRGRGSSRPALPLRRRHRPPSPRPSTSRSPAAQHHRSGQDSKGAPKADTGRARGAAATVLRAATAGAGKSGGGAAALLGDGGGCEGRRRHGRGRRWRSGLVGYFFFPRRLSFICSSSFTTQRSEQATALVREAEDREGWVWSRVGVVVGWRKAREVCAVGACGGCRAVLTSSSLLTGRVMGLLTLLTVRASPRIRIDYKIRTVPIFEIGKIDRKLP